MTADPLLHDRYELDWDRERLDIDATHAALAATYWSPKVRRDVVERAIANSLCLAVYERVSGAQVAFARVVTDRATFAWICDVVVFEGHRGRGLGKRIVQAILAHPELTTLRRFLLATQDAQGLYAQFEFTPVVAGRWLERRNPPGVWSE